MSNIDTISYLSPSDLVVAPTSLSRILAVGSCQLEGWPAVIEKEYSGCVVDFHLTNNAAELPLAPPVTPEKYDFQLVQIALRSVIPEGTYFRLEYTDAAAYERLYAESLERMRNALRAAMRWNEQFGILTFVFNLRVPQRNPLGRLLPRYDLRNMVYFVEKINEALAQEIATYANAYLFDIEGLARTFGTRWVSDDIVRPLNHGTALTDGGYEWDQNRLAPVLRPTQYYPQRNHEMIRAGCAELLAMYRTVHQIDAVKIVIFDIDDTIWRGVAAELPDGAIPETEGWPLGMLEAIGYLKRRGIVLAIVSKNTESRIEELWPKIIGNKRLQLSDFTIRKINWNDKPHNIQEILRDANLLPQNALFVDDNPVERDAVASAFPGIRTIGPNPYVWRRILLWAAEMQVTTVTAEAALRGKSIQAKIVREKTKQAMSREDYLNSLNITVDMFAITNAADLRFQRVFELINKANQFNTNGKRWTLQECTAALMRGIVFYAFSVRDRFAEYGLVGVLVVNGPSIDQFVMSCRVVGMDVEIAVVSNLANVLFRTLKRPISATVRETDKNLICRDVYQRCGFDRSSDFWLWEQKSALNIPSHVTLTLDTAGLGAPAAN
ncbi:MAG: HAD-IIIC family phosphatase [Hyphomicrobiaceae bacterium]